MDVKVNEDSHEITVKVAVPQALLSRMSPMTTDYAHKHKHKRTLLFAEPAYTGYTLLRAEHVSTHKHSATVYGNNEVVLTRAFLKYRHAKKWIKQQLARTLCTAYHGCFPEYVPDHDCPDAALNITFKYDYCTETLV